MSGKGSTPRPFSVDADTYAERYAKTFSRPIDDPSGYDPREKECPPLTATECLRSQEEWAKAWGAAMQEVAEAMQQPYLDRVNELVRGGWPTRDTLPTTDPESTE